MALRAARSMPPLPQDADLSETHEEEEEEEEEGDAEEGEGDEQFICRFCEKDFRRPDILAR